MRPPWQGLSLAGQLLLLQAAIILVVCVIAAAAVLLDARNDAETHASQKVLGVAQAVAHSPQVTRAVRSSDPPTRNSPIQAYAESVRRTSDTDFVVVMHVDGIRLSHPDPTRIGHHFIGHIRPAVEGKPFTETYTGTLGPSVRAVVPVRDQAGDVVGLVSVGITLEEIGAAFLRELPGIVGIALLAFGVAALGTYALSRRLRRQTHGMGPREITRMYEYWDAVLHSVREGILVLDNQKRVQLANDEATRLLGLPADSVGTALDAAPLTPSLRELAASGRQAVDELHVVDVHTLVVNQRPAVWEGRQLGHVITFRDQTELTALTGELDSVRGFAEALRAQTHEAANRIHTLVALVELGKTEDAVRLATAALQVTQQLTDQVMGAISEPVLSALLLGKASQAHERGVDFVVGEDTAVGDTSIDPRDLVTLVGNLIDNAIDAALSGDPPHRVEVNAHEEAGALVVRVSDTGPGLGDAELAEALRRGWTTKRDNGTGRGLGLALVEQVVRRYGGSLRLDREVGTVFVVRLPLPQPADGVRAEA